MAIFLYDIHYIRASDASAQVLRLSSAPFVTKRTDTPANTVYKDYLKRGGSISRYMFGFGRSFSLSGAEIGAGSLIASNQDGFFDDFKVNGDGFDYQKIEVYTVPNKRSTFAEATLYTTFICEKAIFKWGEVEFLIRDPLFLIDRPINDSLFLGTNADGDDLEGNAADIKGQRKPVTIGKCYHVPLTIVNTQTLIGAVHFSKTGSPAALSYAAAYDQALALSDDGDDANVATLAAATITLDFRTCEAQGLIRLDATPNGTVTVDVVEGATSADRTAAQCAKRAITNYAIGFTPSFDTDSFDDLDAADSSEVGNHTDGSVTLYQFCADLLFSVDAALLVDNNLNFYVKQLTDPTGGTSVATITENDIIDNGSGLEQVDIGDETNGIPSYKTTTLYKRYFHQFIDNDLAGSLTDAQRNDALNEWRRSNISETASVQNVNKSSQALELPSLLTSASDANTRNTARHNLRKVDRTMWILPLSRATTFNVGDIITLQVDRFGMQSGKKFIILGYEIPELTEAKTEYLIYG